MYTFIISCILLYFISFRLTYHPPNITSQKSFALWMCEVHNMVNRKLEKPLFDCSKVNERWRDGWTDGRCD